MKKKDFCALVTGGTTGIGAATSKCLRDNGYNVIASYPPSNSIASKKFSQNENINIIEFDASNFSDTESAIDSVQKNMVLLVF